MGILSITCFVAGNYLIAHGLTVPKLGYSVGLWLIAASLLYLGYLLNKHSDKITYKWPVATVCIGLLFVIDKIFAYKIVSISSVTGNLGIATTYLILTPLLGTYALITVSKVIARLPVALLLAQIGRQTITILALHFFCFKVVSYIITRREGISYANLAYFPVIPGHDEYALLYILAGVVLPMIIYALYFKTLTFFTAPLLKYQK